MYIDSPLKMWFISRKVRDILLRSENCAQTGKADGARDVRCDREDANFPGSLIFPRTKANGDPFNFHLYHANQAHAGTSPGYRITVPLGTNRTCSRKNSLTHASRTHTRDHMRVSASDPPRARAHIHTHTYTPVLRKKQRARLSGEIKQGSSK